MAKAQAKSAAKKPGKEVATVKKNQVVDSDLARQMQEDAAAASHGFESRDMAVPFITILQKLSPQLQKSKPEYIEEAEEGEIYNSATGKRYSSDDGIYVVPCSYTRRWTQWWLRDSKKGSGFVKDWGTDESCIELTHQDDRKRNILNDNKDQQIVESGDYFVLVVDIETGAVEQAIISMSSTQWREAKRWNTKISQLMVDGPKGKYNPRMWAACYHLTTKPESNDDGEWMGWSVEHHDLTVNLDNGAELYAMGRAFAQAVEEGAVKVAPRTEQPEEAEKEEEAPPSARDRKKGGGRF